MCENYIQKGLKEYIFLFISGLLNSK